VQVFDTPNFIKSVVYLKISKMKKLIYGTISLALLGIGVVGCKKDQVQNGRSNLNFDNEFNVSTDGKMLVFETSKNFEDLVTNISNEKQENFISFTEKLSYTSLAKKNELSKSLSDDEGDDLLNSLLNEDGIVQIGSFLYKIDLKNEIVGVLSTSNMADYSDLASLNKANKNIRRFTTGDDVIELAESGAESTAKSCGGIDGGTYPCYSNINQGQIVATLANGNVWRLNPGVKFFRAGIYFRLSSLYEIWAFSTAQAQAGGIKVNNLNGLFTVEIFCKGPEGWCQKRPCGSGDIETVNSGFYYSKTLSEYQQTFYSGSRNLNGYHFFVQGRAKFPNGTATIASPYGGRNINSPY
jgi:hypothetical protein